MPVFTNQAQLTYNGITTNSNITTGEIIEVLSATKTSVTTTYGANDRKTYVVNIVNSGNTAFTNLTVTDNLGAYSYPSTSGTPITLYPLSYIDDTILYFQNGVLRAAPTVTAGNELTITGIGVPAGGNRKRSGGPFSHRTDRRRPSGRGARGLGDLGFAQTVAERRRP